MSKILSIFLIILAFIIGLLLAFAFLFGEGGIVYESAKNRAKDSRIMLAVDMTRSLMIKVYYGQGENYDSFNCENGEVKRFCDDVFEAGSKMIILKDKAVDSENACAYAKLLQKENYWYCADSSGKSDYVVIDPASDGYCVKNISAVCPIAEK